MKQPYFINRVDGQPISMAAIGSAPFEPGDEAECFLIVTAAADKGLLDIHDRRSLVLSPEATLEWTRQDLRVSEVENIAVGGAVPTDRFIWHAVSRAVGNPRSQDCKVLDIIQPSSN